MEKGDKMIVKYNQKELELLARLMRAEALGEGNLGMLMVGNVIVNRALADPETFCRNSHGCIVLNNICSENGTPFLAGGYVHHSVKPPLIQFF